MSHIRNIPLNEACCTTLEGVHDRLWSNGLEVKWARHKPKDKTVRWQVENEEEKFEVHLGHVRNKANKRVNRLVIQGMEGWNAAKLDQVKVVLTAGEQRGAVVQPPLGGLEASMPEDYHPSPNVFSDEVVDRITEAARTCVRRADAREAEENCRHFGPSSVRRS